jgi:hypothetical protein
VPRKPVKRKKKPTQARHTTAQRQAAFLAAYRDCGTVRRACEAASVGRRTHYNWLEDSDEYTRSFEDAKRDAGELLEQEARRRAVEGTIRFKFHKGEPIIDPRTGQPYMELDYSDSLLQFLLKGAMPNKYKERLDVNQQNDTPPMGAAELEAERKLIDLGKQSGIIEPFSDRLGPTKHTKRGK